MHPILAAVWKQGDKWRRKVGPLPLDALPGANHLTVEFWTFPHSQWVQRNVLMRYGILSYFQIGAAAPRGQMMLTQNTTVAQAVGNGESSTPFSSL